MNRRAIDSKGAGYLTNIHGTCMLASGQVEHVLVRHKDVEETACGIWLAGRSYSSRRSIHPLKATCKRCIERNMGDNVDGWDRHELEAYHAGLDPLLAGI